MEREQDGAPQGAPETRLAARVTGLELESWRLLRAEVTESADGRAALARWRERRAEGRPALAAAVAAFVTGERTLDELRAALDDGPRGAGGAFGLDGLSGVRFLNKLVAVTGPQPALVHELRAALTLPATAAEAGSRLRQFVAFLRDLARARRLSARDLQPARAAFFVSVCWHLRDPAAWPAFHLPVRRALARQGGLGPASGDAAADYLAFRAAFLALADALGVDGWELEYLCRAQHVSEPADADDGYLYPLAHRPRSAPLADRAPLLRERAPVPAPADVPGVLRGDAPGGSEHTHTQWLLATLGRALGCRVWIAANDRHRVWAGAPLASLSVRHFPSLTLDPASRRVVELIDVVWLHGSHRVAAAFEVEHTTAVYSGLLRMADLAALCPNLTFPLYVVTPAARLEKVRRELARPAFQALGVHRRCGFFSAEALESAAAEMTRWATSPAAIERLAERVADSSGEELAG